MMTGCGATVTTAAAATDSGSASPGNTAAGNLVVSTTAVSFGTVPVGQTASSNLSVSNAGSAAIHITQISLNGQSFSMASPGSGPITLDAGANYNIKVQFSPKTAGAVSGQLTLASDAANLGTAQVLLNGTGQSAASTAQGTQAPDLTLTTSSIDFGTVDLNTMATWGVTLISTGSAPLTISGVTASGSGFSTGGPTFPLTLDPQQAVTISVNFQPDASGAVTGSLTIGSNASSGAKKVISLTGAGKGTATSSSVLSSLSCSGATFTGAASDSCSVTLSGAAPAGGSKVTLSSTSKSVTIPSSVTIPAGSTTAKFTAAISAVSSAQKVTLTAASGSVAKSYVLQLNAAAPKLTLSTTSVAFGDVTLNAPATKTVTLTSSGNTPLTISGASISGNGFKMSGTSFPLTLDPGKTAMLTVQFDPTTTGAFVGSIALTSNSSTGASTTIILSGTGQSTTTLNGIACSSATVTGAASDACTVTLSGPAPSGGLVVSLASSSTAVKVPASVTVAANASSAGFTATASAVTTAQTATLTARSGSVTKTYALQLTAAAPKLTLSTTSVAFGDVTLNAPATKTVTLTSSGNSPLTISGASISGNGFKMSGANFPLTLNPGKTATLTVQFDPTTTGAFAGSIALTSNSSSGARTTIVLSGTGQSTTTLNGIACSSGTVAGVTSDTCTVTLTGPAPSGGLIVSLASSSTAVKVPASLTVAANATSAKFTAAISAVTTAQKVTLTAQAGGVSKSYLLQLNTQTKILKLESTSLSFGSVTVNTPATQSLTLTSTGTAPLTISAATVTGTGFRISGMSVPVTLDPGQSATIDVEFDPTKAGSATGKLTLTSNADAGSATSISLSGTGQTTSYSVELTWNAPGSSKVPIAGYRVYRTTSGITAYAVLNPAQVTVTTYTDSSVQSGKTYNYYVVSLDNGGNSSAPSNIFTVTIP
jgi:hypothetical protein